MEKEIKMTVEPHWQEGYSAFHSGYDLSHNPYRDNTQLARDWEDGYLLALDEENGGSPEGWE
jgi:hypothetical protein